MFSTFLEVHEAQSLLQVDLCRTATMSPAGKWTRVRGIPKVNCTAFSVVASATRFSGGPGRTEKKICYRTELVRFRGFNVSEERKKTGITEYLKRATKGGRRIVFLGKI